MAKPPTTVDLVWESDLRFRADAAGQPFVLDGNAAAGASPMQALAGALAGCMAVDLVLILQKGRHSLRGVSARLTAERAPDEPHRFVSVTLHFRVSGEVPEAAIERAIALSHDKYCSVWHSLRQDIGFATSFEVAP